MSAQNSAGIQTLLDAEREAQKIVQKDRTKRLKDARTEAQKEVEEYREAKDDEFKKFEKEHTSGNKQAEEEAEKRANEESDAIREIGKGIKGNQATDYLIRAVTEVKPEVPYRSTRPSKG